MEVSIIIPAYNCGECIKKCLDSILNQTFKDFEIIIINDGSKDNTEQVIEKYINEHKNFDIKLINQQNMGVAKTRNKAMKLTKGKYLVFVDNDDFLDRDYLAVYHDIITKGDYDAVIGGYKRPDENGNIVQTFSVPHTEWGKLKCVTGWAKMYKSSYVLENAIEYLPNDIGEDIYFILQAMFLSNKIKIIDYVGYNWFYNTQSVSNTSHRNAKKVHVYYLLDSCLRVVKEKGILIKNFEIIEMYFISFIVWFLAYSTKHMPYKDISEEYDKAFEWLNENFPNWEKNRLLSFSKPEGEELYVRIKTMLFLMAKKVGLAKLVLFVYSRQ